MLLAVVDNGFPVFVVVLQALQIIHAAIEKGNVHFAGFAFVMFNIESGIAGHVVTEGVGKKFLALRKTALIVVRAAASLLRREMILGKRCLMRFNFSSSVIECFLTAWAEYILLYYMKL